MSIFSVVNDIKRFRHIATVLVKYGFGHIIEKIGVTDNYIAKIILRTKNSDKEKLTFASRLYHVIVELGPTFVKFGQILSTRDDLLPEDVIHELKKLQDNIPPFPFAEVKTIIETELDNKTEEIFEELHETAVASASIGQVHYGVLKTGEKVVVKVQRPGIREIIKCDIDIIQLFARAIDKRVPEASTYHLVELINEFERTIIRELDFNYEAHNIERFEKNFEELRSEVIIPQVFREYSSKRVIVMEYIDGVKVTEYQRLGGDPIKISSIGLKAIFKMVFEDGFFHSDPHPGNIFITKDGKVAFLDLGQVAKLSDFLKEQVTFLIVAVSKEDRESVADCLYNLAIKEGRVNITSFRMDIDNALDSFYGKSLQHIEFGLIIHDLIHVARKYRMLIPSNLLLMAKSLLTIERVAKALNPNLDMINELEPMVSKLIWRRWSPERLSKDVFRSVAHFSTFLHEFPIHLNEILRDVREGELRINIKDDNALKHARVTEILGYRISFSLIISALIIGSSFMFLSDKFQSLLFVLPGFLLFSFAGVIGLWFLISILRSGKLR